MRDNRGIFPRTFTSNLKESAAWLAARKGISEEAAREKIKELSSYKVLYYHDGPPPRRGAFPFVPGTPPDRGEHHTPTT